jgi:uncharacterized protein
MTPPQRALIALVRGYRLLLSPWLGNACRFEPTCSVYSMQALERHGALTGSYLSLRRIARCQPFCAGGHDPVPECAAPPLPLRTLFRSLVAADASRASSAHPTSTDKNSP